MERTQRTVPREMGTRALSCVLCPERPTVQSGLGLVSSGHGGRASHKDFCRDSGGHREPHTAPRAQPTPPASPHSSGPRWQPRHTDAVASRLLSSLERPRLGQLLCGLSSNPSALALSGAGPGAAVQGGRGSQPGSQPAALGPHSRSEPELCAEPSETLWLVDFLVYCYSHPVQGTSLPGAHSLTPSPQLLAGALPAHLPSVYLCPFWTFWIKSCDL